MNHCFLPRADGFGLIWLCHNQQTLHESVELLRDRLHSGTGQYEFSFRAADRGIRFRRVDLEGTQNRARSENVVQTTLTIPAKGIPESTVEHVLATFAVTRSKLLSNWTPMSRHAMGVPRLLQLIESAGIVAQAEKREPYQW